MNSAVVKASLRKLAKRLMGTRLFAALLFATDTIAISPIRSREERSGSVVLCPPGGGNIGDAAMVEAILDHLDGPITLVTQGASSFQTELSRVEVRIIPLRKVIRGWPLLRLCSVHRFGRLVAGADHLYVVGADLMDGSYNIASSLSRISALRVAKRLGTGATVVGFSYSPTAHAQVHRALQREQHSARLCVRDPASERRRNAGGVTKTVSTADVVLLQKSWTVPSEADALIASGSSYTVVNASGLIESRSPGFHLQLADVITAMRRRGERMVFLPHVLTETNGDMDACSLIFDAFGRDGDLMIERQLTPREVRGLARHANLTLSGRMHLSVMALGQETPALTLSTQGKVEGLYELFGLGAEDLAFEPASNVESRMRDRIESLDLDVLRAQITAALPSARERAHRNFYSPAS